MDLIGDAPVLNIADKTFRIYSKNTARAPQYIGAEAKINNSMISEGCRIYGEVYNSVLSGGVTVEAGAVVRDSVIMDDVTVKASARVYSAIIDSSAVIESGATVGKENASKNDIAVVASGSIVEA